MLLWFLFSTFNSFQIIRQQHNTISIFYSTNKTFKNSIAASPESLSLLECVCVCVCKCKHQHAYRSQRMLLADLLSHSIPYSLETKSLTWACSFLVRLFGLHYLDIFLFLIPSLSVLGLQESQQHLTFTGCWDPDSDCHPYAASTPVHWDISRHTFYFYFKYVIE